MHPLKISLITAVYNSEKYLSDCISSIKMQTYANIEYIVIDGGSTDGTLAVIAQHRESINYFVSEKDKGIYDALNKGIAAATGDIIGILNADDVLAEVDVIAKIAAAFEEGDQEAIYGDLNYVTKDRDRTIRKWISKPFTKKDLEHGWMPAHPTLYVKRKLFDQFGVYALDFGTAADYELMLRFFYRNQVTANYLAALMVNMRVGGASNANLKQRFLALLNDYKAIKANGIPFAFGTLLYKKLVKIPQFFS